MAHAARPTRCAPDVAVARPFVAVVPGECDYAQRATGGHARCVDGAYLTENYVGPISIVLGCFLLGPFLCPLVFLCPCDTRTRFVPAAPYDVATQQAHPYGHATHVVMMPPQNVYIAEGRPATTQTKSDAYYPDV